MARICFFGLPVSGHMLPGLGVVKELVRRGHEVHVYATPSWSDRIEAVGGRPHAYADPSLENMDPPENALVTLSLAMRVAQRVLPALLRDIEQEPASARPAVLINDSAAPWGVVVARRTGLPSVTSSTTFAINDPVSRKVLGGPHRLVPMLLRGGWALVDVAIRRWELRRTYGVEPPRIAEIIGGPSNTNVVYTSRGFQPLSHTFGANTHFVGPVLDARQERWDDPLPRGFVYISLGTLYHRNPAFFRAAVDATRDLDAHVLLNIGPNLDAAALGDVPDHVRIVRRAPQLAVLDRAGAFVTHGGMNSAHEALLAGVPMVVTPQAVDQFLVAERVAEVGAGIALEPRQQTAARLREAISRVRADPSYTVAARRVGDELRSAGGASRAADVVEAQLATRSAPSASG